MTILETIARSLQDQLQPPEPLKLKLTLTPLYPSIRIEIDNHHVIFDALFLEDRIECWTGLEYHTIPYTDPNLIEKVQEILSQVRWIGITEPIPNPQTPQNP